MRLAFWLGGQKLLRVRVLRVIKNIGHLALLNDFTVSHHADTIGNRANNAEVMRNKQHRHAAAVLNVFEEAQNLRLYGDIQRSGGFVGDQKVWLIGERHGNHYPLALAA